MLRYHISLDSSQLLVNCDKSEQSFQTTNRRGERKQQQEDSRRQGKEVWKQGDSSSSSLCEEDMHVR